MIKPLSFVLTVATGVAVATATAALIETLKLKKRWPGFASFTEEKQSSESDSVVNAGKGL